METEPDLVEQDAEVTVEKVLPIHFAPTRQSFTDQVAAAVGLLARLQQLGVGVGVGVGHRRVCCYLRTCCRTRYPFLQG